MSNQAVDVVFDALGEPVRRRILELLHDGPTPVGRLAERLPVGRPAVSKHLRVLSNAGLIEHRSVGTRNLYLLAPGGMAVAQQWLARTWDTALAAYAAEVSRVSRSASLRPEPPPAGVGNKGSSAGNEAHGSEGGAVTAEGAAATSGGQP
jgi:DNA-binding transcriptional ArsR family regulator